MTFLHLQYMMVRADGFQSQDLKFKKARVLVLGVAYKPDIDDVRESPALDVIGLLQKKGAQVEYHDPYIPHIHHEYDGWKMDSVSDLMKSVRAADAVMRPPPPTSILTEADGSRKE